MNEHTRSDCSRRRFLKASAATVIGSAMTDSWLRADPQPAAAVDSGRRPIVVASANGLTPWQGEKPLDVAMRMLRENADPLDAVIAAVSMVEDNPEDHSVGLGGLPNEDGVVELDASVMHGPTHKAGAVAALRNIRNASQVARLVMRRTDHVLLVGEGALRFSKAHGFKEENLLTDKSRETWLKWKESHSDKDAWLSPEEPTTRKGAMGRRPWMHTYGTINCLAVDSRGDIGGVTTTSGLSNKLPGRVGDSPIIGAGLYVDNAVGAAGSTGRGEANIQNCSSFFIVEQMRAGKSPEDACLEALKRVADRTEARLRDADGRPNYGLTFYAVNKTGKYAGASLTSGPKYAVCDNAGSRLEECVYLYKQK